MVKCEDCGFLALRNLETGHLDEATLEYRRTAETPLEPAGAYRGVPICLMRAYPLHNEFTNQHYPESKEIFSALTNDRKCDKSGLFTPWQQGFTPKEHREMMDRERRDAWEISQRTADRRWRIIELLAFIVAGAVTAIIAALVERGTLFGSGGGAPPIPPTPLP